MQHQDGRIPSAGGLDLYYQSWHPSTSVCGAIAIVHGLGGHSGQFGPVVHHFVPQGYAVYGIDLRGHGRSPGQRGYINHWSEFREDVTRLRHHVLAQHPDVPLFLWGHSLGGVIVLDDALRDPAGLHGIVITAPALGAVGVPPLRMAVGKLLSWVWPRFSLQTGLADIPCSRDPVVAEALLHDPLHHSRGTARLSTEFIKTKTWVQAHAADLQVPLLILHGGDDRVAQPEGSRHFFEQVELADKERYEYQGGYHEIHNDINRDEVLADASRWLNTHLNATPVLQ